MEWSYTSTKNQPTVLTRKLSGLNWLHIYAHTCIHRHVHMNMCIHITIIKAKIVSLEGSVVGVGGVRRSDRDWAFIYEVSPEKLLEKKN